jgi:hypothetical protein
MAQESSQEQPRAPWTKIFTAFKVALDVKKLVLAAAGILCVWLGWCAIGWTFYFFREFPEWKNYEVKEPEQLKARWTLFKAKRASWNLLHELAGPPGAQKFVDAADVAKSYDEYLLLNEWEGAYRRLSDPIEVESNTLKVPRLESNQKVFKLTVIADGALKDKKLELQSLIIDPNQDKNVVIIDGVKVRVEDGKFEDLKAYREGALTPEQIAAKAAKAEHPQVVIERFQRLLKYKPSGKLRLGPWWEDRGNNQYLVVADTLKNHDAFGTSANVLNWLFSDKALVLLEPLVKFLSPVVYLFDDRAGGWDRLYLIFIILWTLTIWGFFGGAICRIAAVQVARNERISLRESLAFTRERFVSFVAAPAFPMALLGIFVIVLMLFGWLAWIPWFGELFAGLFWPVVILIGFIMAIVMVGLIGWPLMIATISTEGTDSFDALSRSYSYIYQAPWQYVWYNFLAVVYGAVLIFFVGFMASLMVFAGKWGVSTAVGPAKPNVEKDREPSYLFYYAPTSYGWRDLLISSNQFTEVRQEITPLGRQIERREFTSEYEKNLTGMNRFGAFLVSLWIYPFFLLILGFGYSYFWSSATIVYFLMRRCVDDTELDEVHQEDEDLDDPFMKSTTAPAPAAPAAPPAKGGTVSLNVVEAPASSPTPPPPTTYTAADHPSAPPAKMEPASPSPEMSPPPSAPTETRPMDGNT